MAKEKDDILRIACGEVLEAMFDEGLAGDATKYELGNRVLGNEDPWEYTDSGSSTASRFFRGDSFPHQHWDVISDFFGVSRAHLLRRVAAKVDEIEKRPKKARPSKPKRGRPKK